MLPVEYDHLKVKEITHLNNYIDPVASKTIYALHLIDGEYFILFILVTRRMHQELTVK
jgi:hypothetical protein